MLALTQKRLEKGGLDESDATLLRSVANQLAVALSNARLFEQMTRNKEAAEIAKEKDEFELAKAIISNAKSRIAITEKRYNIIGDWFKEKERAAWSE